MAKGIKTVYVVTCGSKQDLLGDLGYTEGVGCSQFSTLGSARKDAKAQNAGGFADDPEHKVFKVTITDPVVELVK